MLELVAQDCVWVFKTSKDDVPLLDSPHVEKLFMFVLLFELVSFQLLPVVSHSPTAHTVKSLAPSS